MVIIKERTKEQQQAEKRQVLLQTTNAGATVIMINCTKMTREGPNILNKEVILNSLPQNAAACIMCAILDACTQEAWEPGSFQKTIDEMYSLNNLTKVRFPNRIYATETQCTCFCCIYFDKKDDISTQESTTEKKR